MKRSIPDVDVIMDVLKQALLAYPTSTFINSLMQQYQERGSLSKKQLEGLHSKASKIKDIAPGKLATLQAIILRKPTRYKSTISLQEPLKADDISYQLAEEILRKYPNKLIITQGENGVKYFDGGEIITVPCIKVEVQDTTGAGDTFCASQRFAPGPGSDFGQFI